MKSVYFCCFSFITGDINLAELGSGLNKITLIGGINTFIKSLFAEWVCLGMITTVTVAPAVAEGTKRCHGGARHRNIIATKVASKKWNGDNKDKIGKYFELCGVSVAQWDASIKTHESGTGIKSDGNASS